jgi:chemotaxis protein CheX
VSATDIDRHGSHAIPQALLDNLVTATQEVFETMVFSAVEPHAPRFLSGVPSQSGVVATLAFAGSRRGAIALHTSTDIAHVIAGAMLGVSPSCVNGQMADAMGEVANMIGGTLRTRMAAFEPRWAIAIPTVTMGSNFATVWGHDVARVVVPFSFAGELIFVELVLTASSAE